MVIAHPASDLTRARAFGPRARLATAAAVGPIVLLAGISDAELAPLVVPFLLSFALIAPFAFALKPKLPTFVAGATLVAIGAALVELEAGNLAGDLVGPTLVLVLVAPITEELLKLLFSGLTGATYATAAGAGLGFAATENAVYYIAAWGEPTSTLAVLVIIRTFTDPLLHVDATTLTTSAWRGSTWGLPAGILLHMAWNGLTLVLALLPTVEALGVFFLAAIGLGVLLWVLQWDPDTRWALSHRPLLHPWRDVGT